MKIVEITDDKIGMMTECVEKMLRYGGKIMSCLEELEGGEQYGERGSYGMRGGSMGYRGDEWEETPPVMSRYGERRGRGRY